MPASVQRALRDLPENIRFREFLRADDDRIAENGRNDKDDQAKTTSKVLIPVRDLFAR